MKKLFLLVPVVFVLVWLGLPVQAQPRMNWREALVASKMSGVCGILLQQLTFQQTTDMAGGTEFVLRFWNTEAARLGHTIDEYTALCSPAITMYNQAWDAVGP